MVCVYTLGGTKAEDDLANSILKTNSTISRHNQIKEKHIGMSNDDGCICLGNESKYSRMVLRNVIPPLF